MPQLIGSVPEEIKIGVPCPFCGSVGGDVLGVGVGQLPPEMVQQMKVVTPSGTAYEAFVACRRCGCWGPKVRGIQQDKCVEEAVRLWGLRMVGIVPIETSEQPGQPLLEGEIKVGDRLVWEPYKRHATEEIVVKEIKTNDDGETWYLSAGRSGEHWNEESRMREACIRA